jgi:hypothetical protein
MAGVKFGSVIPEANKDTVLCKVPVGKTATMTINVCNTTSNSVNVNITVGGDAIESGTTIAGNDVLERTDLIVVSGEEVVVNASSTGVVFRASGIWGV